MLAFGPLDRLLDTRKWIAIGGSLVIICLLATLALVSHPPIWLPIGAIIGIGFFSASSTMVMTHGRGIFPDRLIGRGIATMNTSVMLGVACMQTLSGIIIGAFEPLADGARTETAYRALFGSAHRGADRRGRDLQPLAGRQAERRNAGEGALIPGCSARLPFRPGGRMFRDRHKGERHEQGRSRQPQAGW